VHPIAVQPDGLNINLDCGSTHPAALQRAVIEQGADLGIAFDGDGDRVIMVDDRGDVVDGDELLYIIARHRRESDPSMTTVIGTQMTNLGMEQALEQLGMRLLRVKVGDRYILERLIADGLMLGGESSGHIICLDRTTTGDGIIAALQVLTALVQSGKSLREFRGAISMYPQHMINVPLPCRVELDDQGVVAVAVRETQARLGGRGRVLLRPSGTEPVVRVMVEGHDAELVRQLATDLAGVVAKAVTA
jgi:phosphoglucosamine mutase